MNFQEVFSNCSSLQEIPEGLFDYNTKVTDFGYAFNFCKNVISESPYTIINVNGQDMKVHLYERSNYPEYFTAPTTYTHCFRYCSNLTDYNEIPSRWK